MKKILLLSILISSYIFGYSQECTTMWPYIYPDFKDATIYMVSGQKYEYKVNVHVKEGTIHYLDGDIIKETVSQNIFFVEVGKDKYMCLEGKMMKVVGSAEKGFIATLILGDLDKFSESSGGYGTTSNVSASHKATSVFESVKGSHRQTYTTIGEKDSGEPIDLIYKYYIVVNEEVYPANRKGINSKLDKAKKEEFKKFLKENKIKWKDPVSLMVLLDFLNG